MANILIIEDDRSILHAYERMFRHHGNHHIETARSGEDAIEALQKNPLFDVVLSDYNIDGMVNGGDVFHWAKKHLPKLAMKFIFLSTDDEARKICENHQLIYLGKPARPSDIVAAINQVSAS